MEFDRAVPAEEQQELFEAARVYLAKCSDLANRRAIPGDKDAAAMITAFQAIAFAHVDLNTGAKVPSADQIAARLKRTAIAFGAGAAVVTVQLSAGIGMFVDVFEATMFGSFRMTVTNLDANNALADAKPGDLPQA